MKIERISTRLVKPDTCSTMDGPSVVVALTNFDLQFPPVHVERILAYKAPGPPTLALERGLAKVLSEYRECAGRLSHDALTGRPAIVLNDEGALLIEAEAHANLHDLWPFNPSHQLLLDLLPLHKGVHEPFLIQVTRFACGGVILGVASHHQVVDGGGVCEFLEAWALMVQGVPIVCTPLHDRSALMVRDHAPQPTFDQPEYQEVVLNRVTTTNQPDLAIKRMHFSAQLLQKIKAEAIKGAPQGVVYSTFVSLLAHVWKCITKARGLEDEEGETKAFVAVDVRKRLHPPLPKGFFGNVVCNACANAKMKDLVHEPLAFAANRVYKAIQKVNNDYATCALHFIESKRKNSVEQVENLVGIHESKQVVLTPNLIVTSWTNLPFYDLDFGWGTPMFVGPPCIHLEGVSIFAPSPKKDGSIDVVLGLFAPHMEKMEAICFA